MHILVTRPIPGAWETKAQIEKIGCRATLAPLMDIAFEELRPELFDGASGVVATSRNALAALRLAGIADSVKRLQIYCVGEATAQVAVDLKLPNITAGKGGAEELVPVIAERHAKRAGPLVYLRGDQSAFDLKGALAGNNIEVREAIVYRQVVAEALPKSVVAQVKGRLLDAVLLMSPRTAQIWSRLAAEHLIADECDDMIHVCISEAVAAALTPAPRRRTEVASEPNAKQVISIIKGLAAERRQE